MRVANRDGRTKGTHPPVHAPGGTSAVIARRARGAIQQENEFLRSVLASGPFPQYVIDARDLTVKLKNSAAGSGPLPEGALCYSYIPDRERACKQLGVCLLDRVKAGKTVVVLEDPRREDNEASPYGEFHGFPILDPQGEVAYIVETRYDISRRKKFEEALQESERKYRSLFEGALPAILLVDPASDRVLDANREAGRLLGMSTEEILRMHETDLHSPRLPGSGNVWTSTISLRGAPRRLRPRLSVRTESSCP